MWPRQFFCESGNKMKNLLNNLCVFFSVYLKMVKWSNVQLLWREYWRDSRIIWRFYLLTIDWESSLCFSTAAFNASKYCSIAVFSVWMNHACARKGILRNVRPLRPSLNIAMSKSARLSEYSGPVLSQTLTSSWYGRMRTSVCVIIFAWNMEN